MLTIGNYCLQKIFSSTHGNNVHNDTDNPKDTNKTRAQNMQINELSCPQQPLRGRFFGTSHTGALRVDIPLLDQTKLQGHICYYEYVTIYYLTVHPFSHMLPACSLRL